MVVVGIAVVVDLVSNLGSVLDRSRIRDELPQRRELFPLSVIYGTEHGGGIACGLPPRRAGTRLILFLSGSCLGVGLSLALGFRLGLGFGLRLLLELGDLLLCVMHVVALLPGIPFRAFACSCEITAVVLHFLLGLIGSNRRGR